MVPLLDALGCLPSCLCVCGPSQQPFPLRAPSLPGVTPAACTSPVGCGVCEQEGRVSLHAWRSQTQTWLQSHCGKGLGEGMGPTAGWLGYSMDVGGARSWKAGDTGSWLLALASSWFLPWCQGLPRPESGFQGEPMSRGYRPLHCAASVPPSHLLAALTLSLRECCWLLSVPPNHSSPPL